MVRRRSRPSVSLRPCRWDVSASCAESKTQWGGKARYPQHRFLKKEETMCKSIRALLIGVLPMTLASVGEPVEARITKIQISSRAVAFGGASFGSVGQYETLRGVAFGEVDPNDPLNEVITDIKLAPRNARGMVEYNMDFWINKPVDMTRANGTLLHDVPNRGRVRSLELNVSGSGDNTAGDRSEERRGGQGARA